MSKLCLVALIGPSCAGKTVLAKETGLKPFTTLTTRPPRSNEVDGVDYNFISKEEFLERREGGYLIEDIEYAGNFYGTDRRDLQRVVDSGETHYVIVTYEGLEQLKKNIPEDRILSIFVWAPKEQIEERLKKRGDDSESIQRRLALYDKQMKTRELCDVDIPNFDYHQNIASLRLKEILKNYIK